jgi:hypothetical protein
MRAPIRRAFSVLLLVCSAFGLSAACSVPVYEFPSEEPNGEGGGGSMEPATRTPCATDEECAALAATKTCDTEAGFCVECVPEREAELNLCGDGLHCAEDGRCVVGCGADYDCLAGLPCSVEDGRCTNCQNDDECGPGSICQEAACVESCAANEDCPVGFECCEGSCKNPLTDPGHCGGCGAPCADGGDCINGACGPARCDAGFEECDQNPDTRCETDVRDNPQHCGRCGVVCNSGLCAGGLCTTLTCEEGFGDCNQEVTDGCEANLETVQHCGMCGKACSAVHGEPSCGSRGCAIACEAGFDDCDGDVDTGCETEIAADVDHCGSCSQVCSNEHGRTRCTGGECSPTCSEGYGDCDGDPTNGCETDIRSGLDDCGACGAECAPDNASGSCEEGVCLPTCEEGFEDCDGNPENGCEADLAAPETCGSCENVCEANGGTPVCNEDFSCGIACDPGRADCVNGELDGCETDINISPIHCGVCANICPNTLGEPACFDGVCGYSECTEPNAECDGDEDTVCETNINTNALHCGRCANECFYPQGVGICVGGGCVLDDCDDGWADCSAELGCETPLGTVNNCRSCGETCLNEHGSTSCTESGCAPTCAIGWGDCDGNRNNGCETQLNSLSNCGGCGVQCEKAHGLPSCAEGQCEITTCDSGWGDCDDEEMTGSGCETSLRTLTSCGGCDVPCSLAHASESCGSGVCTLVSCETGWADCSAQAGCETQLGTIANCLGCGDTCTNDHGAESCTTGGCSATCDAGWKSCDGNPDNGCETNIRSTTNCGDCGVACNLPNASESCSTGACVVTTCNTGFGDCTSAPGCETALGTLQNCLTCGDSCTNAHGTIACGASGCQATCSAGWDDCNNDPGDGCETSIFSIANCGSCGNVCDIPQSSESCGGGTCTSVACATGFANCDTMPDCETTLGTVSNCRACGEACANAHGTTSCGGGGCSPTCEAGWKSCDNLADNGCERSVRTLTDCGDCNTVCSFPNAAASCSTGSCTMGTCNTGFADCGATAGCETTLGTASNCASCGNTCTNAHGTNSCSGSPGSYDCSPACDTGWKSCDGNPDNGCERSLRTTSDCGDCNVACAFPNAGASCSTGTCTMGTCNTGYADCGAGAGCETQLGTTSNCAVCGNACTNAHGTTSCTGSIGSFDCAPSCSTGWKSCDGNPDNGCERDIRTNSDCGDCDVGCSLPNAVTSCSTGTCSLASCSAGFGDCTASPGCETALGTSTNCSACGDTCTNSHGTTSCGGSAGSYACAPVCEAGWGNCNGNRSDGCETNTTTAQNCGACGNTCGSSAPFCVSGQCANFLDISLVNSNASGKVGGGVANLDISHTLATSPNNYRVVVALVASQGNSVGDAKPTAVTYDGASFTLAKEVFSGNQAWSGIYYIKDANLGAAAQHQVRITTSTNAFAKIANIYELKGVDQVNSIDNNGAATGGTSSANCASDDPSDALTTVTNRSFLVSTVALFGSDSGGPNAMTGQTQTFTTVQGGLGFKAGYKAALPIGSTLITWDMTNCNNASHAIVAFKPATAP